MDEDHARDLWRMLHEPVFDPYLADAAKQAVESCLRSASEITAVWHPLGFMMMRLAAVPHGSLRLHVWPGYCPSDVRAGGRIHEHRWGLASYVICGALRNLVAEISDAEGAIGATSVDVHQLAEIRHLGLEDLVQPTGSYVVPKTVSAKAYAPGDRYYLAPRIFHSTDLLATPCATLVGETTGTGGPSRSLGSCAPTAARSARAVVHRRELEIALGDVLNEIGG